MTKTSDVSSSNPASTRLRESRREANLDANAFKLPQGNPEETAAGKKSIGSATGKSAAESRGANMKQVGAQKLSAGPELDQMPQNAQLIGRERLNETRQEGRLEGRVRASETPNSASETGTEGMSKGNKRAVRRQLVQINGQFSQLSDQLTVQADRGEISTLLSQINRNLIILTRQMTPADQSLARGSSLQTPSGKLVLQDLSLSIREMIAKLPQPRADNGGEGSAEIGQPVSDMLTENQMADATFARIFSHLVQVLQDLHSLEQMSGQGSQNK